MSDDDGREDDPYVLPGTNGVLRNTRGLRTREELEKAQASRSFQRAGQLVERPIEGRFDLDHLQDIHHHLFQDVHDWAGELRAWNPERVEPALGGVSVAYPRVDDPDPTRRLDARLDAAFEALREDDHLKGLETSPERFVERLATHMTAVWHCHAFRDGNTRAVAALFRQLVVDAGYSVSHGFPSNPREFRDALARSAHTGDSRRLQAGLAAELDAGPELCARGDAGREDPTPGQTRAANGTIERRVVEEIDALRHGHYTAMKTLETSLDRLRELLADRGRDGAGRDGATDKARLDARRGALDREYRTLATEHAERTDAFGVDADRLELVARDRARQALPLETTLARRGHDAAAFADAVARWDHAAYELERAPDDPERRRALLGAVRRVRESPGNLVRLDDERRTELVAHYRSLGSTRAEVTVARAISAATVGRTSRDPSEARVAVARGRLARETTRRLAPAVAAQRELVDRLSRARDGASRTLEAHDGPHVDRVNDREASIAREALAYALDRAETLLRHRSDDFVHGASAREGAARDAAGVALPVEAAIVRRAARRTAFDTALGRWRQAERALEARPDDRQAMSVLKARIDQLRDVPALRDRLSPAQLEHLDGQRRTLRLARDRDSGRGLGR